MHNLSVLVYLSAAVNLFSDKELENLLTESREKNSSNDISGLLLYSEGSFIQILEGQKEDLDLLFEKIKHDKRHSTIIKLYQKPVEERMFPDWSMGFKRLKEEEFTNITGFSDILEDELALEELKNNPSQINTLLLSFKKINH